MNHTQDDEIDLFEFFETLWDGKWLISGFTVLAALIGFGYSQVAQSKYEVYIPYTLNVISVSTQQICNSDLQCTHSMTDQRLLSLLGGSWEKSTRSRLFFSTSSPLDLNEYESQVKSVNAALTNEIYEEATSELTIIQTEMMDALLSTEIVATNMLNAKRIIQSIDNGKSAITFGSFSVDKSFPKVPLILAFSILLGGMIGVFFIIARNAIKKRKEQTLSLT